jgi:CHAT domain-containing protein/tetratricopeptide (TPR) repeat protein
MGQLRKIKSARLLLLTTLFLFSSIAFAQKPLVRQQAEQLNLEAYHLLFEQGKDSLALLKYQRAKSLYGGRQDIDLNLTDACFGIGIIWQMRGDFKQAIGAYKESIRYQQKIDPKADSSYFYAFILIAENFIHLNHYDSAYTYYGKAELLLSQYPHIPQALRFYNGMGNLYYLFGNYAQSKNYFEKVLKILHYDITSLKQADEQQTIRYVMYNNNIAGALRKLGLYQEAIEKIKGLIKYGIIQNVLYQHLASVYLQLEQPDSAKTYLSKIKINEVPNSNRINTSSEKIDYYNSLGAVYVKTKYYNKALSSYDQAQRTSLANFSRKSEVLAIAYAGKGQVYESQNNYQLALKHYQLAIQSLHFTFNNSGIYQNPKDYSNTVSPLILFEVFRNKAHAFRKYFGQTRKTVDLEASLSTYQLAFQLADRIRKGYDSDEAKMFFNHTVSPVYEEAIATAFQLFGQTRQEDYLQAAFALAEQSKAAVLAESLRELKIKKIPGISPALLQREINLKRNNTALNVKLVEDTVSSARKEMYRDHIRENEIELAKVLKEFEKNKQYYQLKYDTGPVKVAQIQEKLDDETAFVEYFVGKNNLYVFVITQDDFQAKQLGSTASFMKNWHVLYKALYQTKHGFHYQGNRAAHQLYQQLIAPAAILLAGKQRLLIIPDKELCYLPFEALISDANTGRYLIQNNIISYAYSGKLLRHTSQSSTRGPQVSILAMAPFGDKNRPRNIPFRADALSPLPASAGEVAQVGGQVYLGKEAIKERMLLLAGKYDIIHLATHAQANNQKPLQSFIAFYPGDAKSSYRLYVPEIYNLRLDKLKLVVLSACETGSGKLVQGEGIMSLARAFAYAGCPSTITTLWKAEEKSSAYISTRLHQYLRAGKAKDAAVRLAKLDYLNSQTNLRRRSPVYWANFIFIGDQAPVYPDDAKIGWITGAVLMGLLIGWIFYKGWKANPAILKKARKAWFSS